MLACPVRRVETQCEYSTIIDRSQALLSILVSLLRIALTSISEDMRFSDIKMHLAWTELLLTIDWLSRTPLRLHDADMCH